MSACARNVEPAEPEGVQVTVTATLEGNDMTRTTVQDGGTQVYWETAEEIKVFFRNSIGRFISQNTEQARTADFTGAFSAVVGSNEGEASSHLIWGLYPFRADATYDGSSVTTTLPSAQTGRAGSFAKNTNITIAQSVGLNLAFYNVCGGLRFSLTQEGIKRITFEGNNGEALAGKIKIAFEDGVPVVSEVVAKDSVLTLTAPNGGTFQTGVWYYLSAIPGILSGGYKMVFYKESESAKLTSTSSVRIKRGIFGSLADADEDLVFKPTGGGDEPNPDSIILTFPDENSESNKVGSFEKTWTAKMNGYEYSITAFNNNNWSNWTYIKAGRKSAESVATIATVSAMPAVKAVTVTVDKYTSGKLKSKPALVVANDASFSDVVETVTVDDLTAGYVTWNVTAPKAGLYYKLVFDFAADGNANGIVQISKVSFEPTQDSYIQFADPIAKYACVEKFDTDGDGEVSYEEAAAATSLSGIFTNWNTVTEFDEIRHFTNVTSTVGVFSGLNKLTHITIPDQITTLGTFQNCSALDMVKLPAALSSLPTYCFSGCTDLKSVILPTGITTIPNYAFQGCAMLETLAVPSTVSYVGSYAFSGCTALTGIDLPPGVKTIGNYAFQNCVAISSVDFPSSLTSIGQYAYSGCTGLATVTIGNSVSLGQYAFSGCTSLISATIGDGVSMGAYAFSGCTALTSVILPSDLTSIPSNCFKNCSSLATISWPSALQSIGAGAFYGCTVSKDDSDASMIELPATVKSISSQAFCGVRHLIMPSTLAISIQPDSFSNGFTRLYVPADMVEMYKVRTNWSAYKLQIFSISNYPATLSSPAAEPVDLGLSVKWASWNVGASAPEEYGTHFAWGEVEGNWYYNWSTYKWCNGTQYSLTKYNKNSSYGIVDNKTVLDPEDDAAHVNWGDGWRMPTDSEWTELMTNCTWTWTTLNGVNGRLYTGPNGNSIFLPAAGGKGYSDYEIPGRAALFWSSSLYMSLSTLALDRNFYVNQAGWYAKETGRYNGLSIRPVCP